jgi:hypothetical protein
MPIILVNGPLEGLVARIEKTAESYMFEGHRYTNTRRMDFLGRAIFVYDRGSAGRGLSAELVAAEQPPT